MPWRETKVEDQRKMFIKFYLDDEASITSLCREFEVSRKTAYKWIERFKELGDEGLKDQRRARINQTQTDEELVQSILSVKNKRLTWDPKKFVDSYAIKRLKRSGHLQQQLEPFCLRMVFRKQEN